MESRGTIFLVRGYHACTPVPKLAITNGLQNRVAILFDTSLPGEGEMYFDAELCAVILEKLACEIQHDEVLIPALDGREHHSMSDFIQFMLHAPDGYEGPPVRIQFKNGGKIVWLEETEAWAMVGGPSPYSDSYTLSLYSEVDMFPVIETICRAACLEKGVEFKESITGADPAVPMAAVACSVEIDPEQSSDLGIPLVAVAKDQRNRELLARDFLKQLCSGGTQ